MGTWTTPTRAGAGMTRSVEGVRAVDKLRVSWNAERRSVDG
jgi:hypothetical protein